MLTRTCVCACIHSKCCDQELPVFVLCKSVAYYVTCFNSAGTILVRTNRISRIFNEKLLLTGTVSYLGNYWQLFILGCLLTIELVLSIFWVFGLSSTHVSPEVIYSKSSKDASLVCNLTGSNIGFSLWLIYNAGLVVVCTYQAFLVRKVPQNYNESRLIAFNMTTICITVLVYIPSYMGTTAWYRTVISSFMFLFLGTLTWATIFAPKIYIIVFRPHKNVPMRPSVSSITLGVITPSSTVVSNLNEQGMSSRQNSFAQNEDESSESLWANFDSSRNVNENEAPDDHNASRDTCSASFADEFVKYVENEHTKTNTEMQHANAIKLDSQGHPETTRQKKTSAVHFEDKVTTENVENKDEHEVIPRKKSSYSQGGILRKTYNSDNFENLNGLSVKKKKTSLVRFQDEVTNYEFNNPDCNRVTFPAKMEELDQVWNSEDTGTERAPDFSRVSNFSNEKRNTGNGVTEQGRKRKISVFSFE